MEAKEMTCCVTGHRPRKFPWDYDDAKKREAYRKRLGEMTKEIIAEGCRRFLSGGALGVDLDFAEIVLALRETDPRIRLEIAVPCRDQADKWNEADRERYRKVLLCADAVTVLSETYTAACMRKRNEYMVNESDLVLAVWNGERSGGTYSTIRYAERMGKPIRYYALNEPQTGD